MTSVNETTSSRRDLQREKTQTKIREAALQVFHHDSMTAATIDDIIKLTDINHSTFYFHFPTKNEILTKILRDTKNKVTATINFPTLSKCAGRT